MKFIFLTISILLILFFISILISREIANYIEYKKKKNINVQSKKIIYYFTLDKECNLNKMIEYHKNTGWTKYKN